MKPNVIYVCLFIIAKICLMLNSKVHNNKSVYNKHSSYGMYSDELKYFVNQLDMLIVICIFLLKKTTATEKYHCHKGVKQFRLVANWHSHECQDSRFPSRAFPRAPHPFPRLLPWCHPGTQLKLELIRPGLCLTLLCGPVPELSCPLWPLSLAFVDLVNRWTCPTPRNQFVVCPTSGANNKLVTGCSLVVLKYSSLTLVKATHTSPFLLHSTWRFLEPRPWCNSSNAIMDIMIITVWLICVAKIAWLLIKLIVAST